MVGEEGLEPSRYCYHKILSLARLPVPPFAHRVILTYFCPLCYNLVMNPKDGGQTSSDLQRQTAASIARRKVLAAYQKNATTENRPTLTHARTPLQQRIVNAQQSAQRAQAAKSQPATQQPAPKPQPAVQPTARPAANTQQSQQTTQKTPVIDPEAWKKYHAAWQEYYQKYYSQYYSNAAKNYVARERLKDAREAAEDEEIMRVLNRTSKNGDAKTTPESDSIREELRNKIRAKAAVNMKKNRRIKKYIPVFIGVFVVLVILFLQYNRLIFAPIMAYMSPGNVPASQIDALDPTITQTVSADPRLIIPKLNVDVPVHFGIQPSEVMSAMNHGVAHYRISGASAFPGEIGNTVITGHSAGDVYSSNPYKFIFSGLERLESGDLIYVNYNSVRYTYKVTKKEVVEPSNVASLKGVTDKPILTLVTCTPLGTSRYRLLVTGEQISPSYEGATEAPTADITVDEGTEMPANEPGFFEGIWNWLTGN